MIQNETNETDIFLRGTIAQELDFYRITETVSQLAASEEGRALLKQREAVSDKEQITKLKSLGREWSIYLNSTRPAAIHGWPSVGTVFPLLGIDGAQLSQEQLFTLALFCTAAQTAKTLIESAAEEFEIPNLNSIAQEMPSLKEAGDMIFSVLDKDGNVRDLPELRTIRAKIASLHKEIESSIRKYTSDPALNGALQSNVPAFRADRELLAVRADHRSAVSGIVHEVSASGQTIYVEPEEVVRANNELIQQEFALQSELRRIFRELTAKIGIFKDDFTDALSKMTLLDTTCAAAKWQSSTRGVFAEDCDMQKEPPAIYKARHPLLGDKAVPVDISFMDSKRVLIITGPNTGGKTVTLKTIGLFALLNQAGLPVPAAEGTRLPVFSSIFADIGDEQSIDDSLSTFSSHMKKTAQMVNCADSNSLILLDELASGTDPQEGGAIAMATLDTLIERGSFTIVTTHHGILKNYGYTNKSCINASVEFDTGTLAPTYRLLMGVPGESHAIDIALKSGLPQSVVNKAREYISTEQADVSTLIRGLTQKHAELDSLLKTQNGYSGCFIIKDKSIIQLSQTDLVISFCGSNDEGVHDFCITTPDGDRFYFTEREHTDYRYIKQVYVIPEKTDPSYKAVTAWRLSHMITANNTDTVRYEYSKEPFSRYDFQKPADYRSFFKPSVGIATESGGGNGSYCMSPFVHSEYPDKRIISAISSRTCRIKFTHAKFSNTSYHTINGMHVISPNGEEVRNVSFNYTSTIDGRVLLSDISVKDGDRLVDKQEFSYFSGQDSNHTDLFGYKNYKPSHPERTSFSVLDTDGKISMLRIPYFESAKGYTLEKITDGLGATTTFE